MKPEHIEDSGSKTSFKFLQSWLRQVTSSSVDQKPCVTQLSRGTAGSSKRRKGRPKKYVAAAGDRTLTGDALLVDTTSDSGLARCAVVNRAPSPSPPPRLTTERPPPAASQLPPTTSASSKTSAAERPKVGRRKEQVPQRGRRQPVKFIPAVERRSSKKPPRSTSSSKITRRSTASTAPSMSSQVSAAASQGPAAVAAPVKRPRGRPRKHPVVQVFTPAPAPSSPVTHAAPCDVAETRRQLTDVEGDSSDSDVIVTGYTAPRHVTTAPCHVTSSLRDPPTRRVPASADVIKRNDTTRMTSEDHAQRSSASEPPVNAEVAQPIKRKRGRPRKYPLPTDPAVAVSSTSTGSRRTAAADKHPATADKESTVGDRRRVTRALTTAQIQHQWDASRSAAESSITPARNTPPLYYELSSSSDDEIAPVLQPDVGKRPKNVQRKRKRRRSIPSRSLELSFSSIEKDDASGGEGTCYPHPTSGRSRDRRAAEMTSTPSYDRSTSVRDSTLRSRWINVENRSTEPTTTTTAAIAHRDAGVEPDLTPTVTQSSVTRHSSSRQSPAPAAGHRRKRRRRRSSDNQDPAWRRYPIKPSRRSSRADGGQPDIATCSTTPHVDGSNDTPAYDEAELDILVELQRRLASTSDGHVLRQVVEVIEASGRYHVEDATFDFDLCSLDRRTINELRRCLGV